MNGFDHVASINGQVPTLTPELVQELGRLDELKFMMILFLVALFIMAFLVAVLFRQVNQHGRQVQISERNSDRLAVNSDAIQKQSSAAEVMANAVSKHVDIVQSNLAETKGVREDIGQLSKAHESGVHDLRKLIEEETEAVDNSLKKILDEVGFIQSKLDETLTIVKEGDGHSRSQFSELGKQLNEVHQVVEALARTVSSINASTTPLPTEPPTAEEPPEAPPPAADPPAPTEDKPDA